MQSFKIKLLGDPTCFLGCNLFRQNGTIWLNQEAYAKKVLVETGFANSKASKLPISSGYKAPAVSTAGEDANKGNKAYSTDIGKMSWLSPKTRPDLALAAVKSMFRYLRGTMKLGIALGSSSNYGENDLHGFVNASHQDCTGGHSTEGYIFFMNDTPISWRSAKQKVVAPIALLKKDGYSSTTKWIDNRYFFVKEAMKKGLIDLVLISGDNNIADWLTKPLAAAKFDKFRAALNLAEPPMALDECRSVEIGLYLNEFDDDDDNSDEIDEDVDEFA
ncbi:hypothetical protein NUU61_001343 [Penicillium alfredii]|uniref:Reverse transcriptase Ty1/copia-type domain-containing protein n=1 Tax=Penicillium alfredii TaxID=1506179 RepID=A0A9W9G457_9EURO|nr:uncharacterized protein NUU61_001343 [Penicillium alfredii]KAJ5111713.1 hypothetical protein NUU61_001343 [Penicillium alfredii]